MKPRGVSKGQVHNRGERTPDTQSDHVYLFYPGRWAVESVSLAERGMSRVMPTSSPMVSQSKLEQGKDGQIDYKQPRMLDELVHVAGGE
jgi:hypothetical protein